jgi:tRNA pseudouridine13 synthase
MMQNNEQTQPEHLSFKHHIDDLPFVYQQPSAVGTIRQKDADFEVTEHLAFEPSGQGEHLFVFVEKQNCNSQWLADELQKHFKLRSQDIGYAGKKDRHSLSRQWFSLHLPGKDQAFDQEQLALINNQYFKIITSTRHNKKLRKGVIKKNEFKIVVRNLTESIESKVIEAIKQKGFANYFGYQRFGHNGNNLVQADKLFNNRIRVRSRNKKSIYYSAVRSYLFNLIVAERIKQQQWHNVVEGDCLSLAGSHTYFSCQKVDQPIEQRLAEGDIHISGWLAGSEGSEAKSQALTYELNVIETHQQWLDGLTAARVKSARRPMRVFAQDLSIEQQSESQLTLQFSLPSGCFATSLMRELFVIEDAGLSIERV